MGIKYCSIHEQSADIMTKGFTNADSWDAEPCADNQVSRCCADVELQP